MYFFFIVLPMIAIPKMEISTYLEREREVKERERETERDVRGIYLKELAHSFMGGSKSKICRLDQQAGKSWRS